MSVFNLLKEQVKKSGQKKIIFPEGEDKQILQAANKLQKEQLVAPIVLGKKDKIEHITKNIGLESSSLTIIDPDNYSNLNQMAQSLMKIWKKDLTLDQSKKMLQDNNYLATMLVKQGLADGMVSGIAHSTAETVRPALQLIKASPGMKRVSGSFIMEKDGQQYLFADCAINIDPDSENLAEIAYQTAITAKMINLEPRVAFLSFSTKGSAKGSVVDKVRLAKEIFNRQHPEIIADGELQFDAAFVPQVMAKKAPASPLKGRANIFIFPELQSGNIAYKMVQRLAKYTAVGPILQGLAAPVNDLSRGASASDVYQMALLTAAQANIKEQGYALGD